MGIRAILVALAALAVIFPASLGAVELVMVEQPGCVYCERWDHEISEIYPKTAVGRHAPLRRAQLHEPAPDGITYARRITYTPTFVVINQGHEIARIEGYPGEDFFWVLLERLLAEKTGFEEENACVTC